MTRSGLVAGGCQSLALERLGLPRPVADPSIACSFGYAYGAPTLKDVWEAGRSTSRSRRCRSKALVVDGVAVQVVRANRSMRALLRIEQASAGDQRAVSRADVLSLFPPHAATPRYWPAALVLHPDRGYQVLHFAWARRGSVSREYAFKSLLVPDAQPANTFKAMRRGLHARDFIAAPDDSTWGTVQALYPCLSNRPAGARRDRDLFGRVPIHAPERT